MQAVAPAWLDPLRELLLPDLQAVGLDIDTRSRLNIEAWLDAAQARGLLTDDPRCAQGALRAIVSKSARDQQLFDQVFESWRRRWDHAAELLGDPKAAKTPPAAAPTSLGPAPARTMPLAYSLALVAVLAVAVIVATDYARKQSPDTPAPPPVVQPDKPRVEAPAPVIPQIDLAATAVVGQTEVQAPPWLFGLHPAAYAALVLLLGSAGWVVRRTRKEQLARITTRENLREQEVFARQLLPVSGERRVALRAAARSMRKLRPTELRILDVDASTRATASRAGAFEAAHRTRMAMPEYLILVDRACSSDQQAHWAAEMARDLAAEGVALALYEFDRDPRWVAPLQVHRSAGAGAVQRYLPLSLLAARHAGQGLIVLADGHGFIDPASGTLHGWLQGALAWWPRRVLMTPRPLANWGAAEELIAGAGQPTHADAFLLLPARIESLTAAAHWFDGGELPDVDPLPGAPALLPPVLEDDSGRWVGREAPAAAELVALIEQLRGFLGHTAYTWLAASAAYPHLSADLTAYLAHQLSDAPPAAGNPAAPADARLLEARLLGIAQLPWCRFGMMPDWLRRALFLSLAPATREQVRAVLARLFGAAGQGDAALGVSLGVVATDDPERARKGRLAMLRSLGRRIGLSGVVENEPSDSPLRDVIYLGVLRGDFDPELSLDATEEFARAVRAETGTRLTRNPLRWIAALLVAVLFPLVWLKWWAGGPMLRYASAAANTFVQSWKESYSNAESFYAAIGKWFVRLGRRLLGAKPAAPTPEQPAALVYLSYSRSEAEAFARALRERLVTAFGLASVWDGTLDISAGASWQDEIRRALERCSVMVVFLGRNAFRDDKTWRIEEVAHALATGKRLIPVLVDGAFMPAAADLPPSIRGLARLNSFELHADRMDSDLDRLTDVIARLLAERKATK